MSNNIIEKWANCQESLAFGYFGDDESGRELRDEGYNENYGCEQPNIVISARFEVRNLGGDQIARLFGIGKIDDPKVIKAITAACGDCPHFRSRK